jgi:hypothetical protein
MHVVLLWGSSSGLNIKVKANLSLCLTNYAVCHEGAWGSGCIDPCFLDLSISWRWIVSFTPRPPYPLRERAPGIHSIRGWVDLSAGLDNMEKWKFLTVPGLELLPLSCSARIASRYIDWAIPAPPVEKIKLNRFRRVYIEKPIVIHLGEKFPTFDET